MFAQGRAAAVIAAAAECEDCDLVVVGRRGRGEVAELVLGSTSLELTHSCKSPVVVVSHHRQHSTKPAPILALQA